jgi:hypothetical protein
MPPSPELDPSDPDDPLPDDGVPVPTDAGTVVVVVGAGPVSTVVDVAAAAGTVVVVVGAAGALGTTLVTAAAFTAELAAGAPWFVTSTSWEEIGAASTVLAPTALVGGATVGVLGAGGVGAGGVDVDRVDVDPRPEEPSGADTARPGRWRAAGVYPARTPATTESPAAPRAAMATRRLCTK